MSAKPPSAEVKALFDANPGKYSDTPEADGYNPTRKLMHRLAEAPRIPNPVEQPKIPKPMVVQVLYEALDDAEVAAIGMNGWRLMRDAIDANNREAVKRLVHIAWKKGWLSEAKYNLIVGQVDAEIDDPSWQAEVNGSNDLRVNWPNQPNGLHFKYIHKTVMGRS